MDGLKPLNPDLKDGSFASRCLNQDYMEHPELRNWQSYPEFQRVLGSLNKGEYETACQEASVVAGQFPDLDLIYAWHGSALIRLCQYGQAETVLTGGLTKANRKYILCCEMGKLTSQTGRMNDTMYWWAQAWHCQETVADFGRDETAFLYLHYVADELGLAGIAQSLLNRVDRIRAGQVRLVTETVSSLRKMTRAGSTNQITTVMRRLAERYLTVKSTHQDQSAVETDDAQSSWIPGTPVHEPGRLDVGLMAGLVQDEAKPRPSLAGALIIPCLRIDETHYEVKATLAQKTTANQACTIQDMPPGEYLIAFNPFEIKDEEAYRKYWDGQLLDLSGSPHLAASITRDDPSIVRVWPGPRGGVTYDETGQIVHIKANTGLCVGGGYPLVIEFLMDRPYYAMIKPGQTVHLIMRTHACIDE